MPATVTNCWSILSNISDPPQTEAGDHQRARQNPEHEAGTGETRRHDFRLFFDSLHDGSRVCRFSSQCREVIVFREDDHVTAYDQIITADRQVIFTDRFRIRFPGLL